MPIPKTNIIEAILRHTPRMADGECWITTWKPAGKGYVYVEPGKRGTKVQLHRLAYEAFNAEPIPDGLVVCHTCDNPQCINPEHMFLGTHTDNMHDCIAKGRFVTPPQSSPAKLV